MSVGEPLDRATAKTIAHHYPRPRSLYWYVRVKLVSDPLYRAAIDALRRTDAPLLDFGCGIGLLAQVLRAGGVDLDYRGVDNDAGKIARARRAATTAALAGVRFECIESANALPTHRGSVAVLDVLQYLPDDAQAQLLDAAITMLTPGAQLLIRTGIDDGGWRARLTRYVDILGHGVGWMNVAPKRYPQRDALAARLQSAGLRAHFSPLHGRVPFNNWLVVATRE
ncbi:MAG: methyltransferase domain-containing protein [Luteimonas sp.]